ncbi:uncharacterized protein LOC131074131 isoform X1 [Cryptomeria japonica]|uniref:uncharacterized protein LOC131074131 isoform X1 n=1 Tax=Cryptomeria japonica TaxID=3369 RepID=UPI0027DA2066|nr:uncharacterized protein LOC131074131 isoform X1 [Cryptomeria japonica]
MAMFAIKWSFLCLACILLLRLAGAVTAPLSNCYTFDKSGHIYDFTEIAEQTFAYDGKKEADLPDLEIRFCNDVQRRSDEGYINFGHFAPFNYFVPGNGNADFVQEYYFGDLQHCEFYTNKLGRTAQVNIICGNCSNGATCKDEIGCICSVSYNSPSCRVIVELAISCGQPGPRIFQGFTVGFHPRAWEVVYNGITQWGYEEPRYGFSFGTEETKVSLYFTAIGALSKHVRKPTYTIIPENGLEVKLSGSASTGDPPTTLSPTSLDVIWRCEKAQDTPYAVNITVPIEGYPPVHFFLGKLCEYKQAIRSNNTKGWATFGLLCCILIVLSTAFCCAGFIYKTRVEHQHGLYALPGMTILAACIEVASGATNDGYSPANNINQSTWERSSVSDHVSQRVPDNKYGTVG